MHNLKNKPSLVLLVILLLINLSFGQTPSQRGTSSKEEDDAVVRITTNLVQVDVVVTDKEGRQVTDLRPEDFEILEDNHTQKITNFSYVAAAGKETVAPARPIEKDRPAAPPVQLRPEQVKRTIAIVVDNLGLSLESVNLVRDAVKKFVDEQMQPGDLVAIVPTGGGTGFLQQFTSDKRQLYAAIKQIRWQLGRGGVSAFEPVSSNADMIPKKSGSEPGSLEPDIDVTREEFFSVGTLGAINQVIRGLRQLPGRKAVVLLSDGFRLYDPNRPNNFRILDALRRLTDLANRASVVAYTIDARGVPILGLTAADSIVDNSILKPNGPVTRDGSVTSKLNDRILDSLQVRRDQYLGSQEGLKYLADGTGGFFTADLNNGLKKILEDQKGYYLIGYDPEESTFAPKERKVLHKLSVKVKRSGLKVRSRGGFYGFTDEESRPVAGTPSEQMVNALSSPFASSKVPLRMTPLFLYDEKQGPYLRALLHIDAANLTFTEETDGLYKADFNILAVTFGEDSSVIDQLGRNYSIRVPRDSYQRIVKDGFAYIIDMPIKKAGAYQFRVAVRDEKTEHVGSASQFIEVPDIQKGYLQLSGIVVNGRDPKLLQRTSTTNEEIASSNFLPAVRKFKRGMMLDYSYFIYNAHLSRTHALTQLKTQVKLYRNGQEIFAGSLQNFEPKDQNDIKKLYTGGKLKLSDTMTPGEYALQVLVTDELADEKNRTTSQWIDFEVVE